jgi:hypothetical protein
MSSGRVKESGMDVWLTSARDAIAAVVQKPVDELQLDQRAVDTLLRIAAIAAHESGERINAPLLCYLVGRADQGADLQVIAEAIEANAP